MIKLSQRNDSKTMYKAQTPRVNKDQDNRRKLS